MTFGKAKTKEYAVWKKYFDELHTPVPEGQPGISPLGIWLQLFELRK
jgi:hypothetical protein